MFNLSFIKVYFNLPEALSFIEKNFKEHPGSTENFWFPTTQ